MFTAWLARRDRRDDDRVLTVLTRGERSTYEVLACSRLSPGRGHLALLRLETTGRIVSRWDDPVAVDAPTVGRRRLYRLADPG